MNILNEYLREKEREVIKTKNIQKRQEYSSSSRCGKNVDGMNEYYN